MRVEGQVQDRCRDCGYDGTTQNPVRDDRYGSRVCDRCSDSEARMEDRS